MIALLAAAAVVVGPTVQVSRSGAERAHEEVFLAAHPTDARRLIGCSIVDHDRYAGEGMHVVGYTSEDGGGNWSRAVESSLQLGDPMCAYGPDGSAYFLGINTDDEHWKDAVWWMEIFRSGDGGRTWGAGVRWPAGDRPYLAFGSSESTGPGIGYLVYSIRARALDKPGPAKTVRDDSLPVLEVLRSADGWKTWNKTAVGVAVGPAFPTASGAVVLSDGALATLWVKRSTKKNDAGEDVGQDPHQELNLTRLEAGSEIFGRTVKIADVTAGNDYSATFFSLAGDATHGPFRDRLYAAWADTATPRSRIFVSSSSDGGASWTAPRAINGTDAGAAGAPAARDDYMPTVAVNRDGVVGATFRRRTRPDEDADVWFAFSSDGGRTWSDPVLAAAARGPVAGGLARATLRPGDDGKSPGSRSAQYFKGGDTSGLAADADGVFHALWADQRSGIGQVYSATIRVGAPAPGKPSK
ncbi:MAG TPA: sialidase family protein [Thermoanaerobaculia bacterium]|jgi:hypothetical protein